jgi:hypothetical protein
MNRQRWGTFSVRDHLQPYAFLTEVFLYDRLIIPHPADDEERKRWMKEKRAPGLLDACLEVLGDDLVVRVPWTSTSMIELKSRYELTYDVALDIGYGATRAVLPMAIEIPNDVWAVAAYPSREEFAREFGLQEKQFSQKSHLSDQGDKLDTQLNKQQHMERLGWLLGHSFLVPHGEVRNDQYLLKEAVKLASSDEFQEYREALYQWEDHIVEYNISDEEALRRMHLLLKRYNALVEAPYQQKQKKFIYTVVSSVVSDLIKPLAPLVKTVDAFSDYHAFPKFAHDQTIPDKYKPAAMFYDIHRHFGWS